MKVNSQGALRTLNIKKIWIPIIFSVSITIFLLRKKEISIHTLKLLGEPNWYYICMAVGVIILRDLGYMWRIRLLTNNSLSWKSSFYITILWEFSSAVTPSVIGGGIVAIFLFLKEGLKLGRSLAYVILAGILDNLFFIMTASRGFWGTYTSIFNNLDDFSIVRLIFWTSYALITLYTSLIAFGLFINPKLLRLILIKIKSIKFLRRWRQDIYELGKDVTIASKQFQGEQYFYWIKVIFCTFSTWVIRYSFLNFLIASYIPLTIKDHLTIFNKQVIIWAVMLLPLTPGGSGIAETLFQHFYGDMLGEYTTPLDVGWRIFTFYLYLILGTILLPRWIARVFPKGIKEKNILS